MKIKITFVLSMNVLAIVLSGLLTGCAMNHPASTGKTDMLPEQDQTPKEVKVREFILGPGDKIEISVYRHDDLKKTTQIDTSGKITYPLLGDIQAGGLSIFQLRDNIRDGLSKYFIEPQVSIEVTAVQSQKIIVLGEVKNPGLFALESTMNTLDAVSKAGGFTNDAQTSNVLLIRGGLKTPELITLDIARVFSARDMAQNVSIQSGDIIYVPSTVIANVSRFFDHLSRIISPVVSMESGYYIGQQIEHRGSTVSTVPIK